MSRRSRDIYALRMRLAEDMGTLSPVSPKPEVLEDTSQAAPAGPRPARGGAPDYTAYAKLCNDFHERLLELSANLVLREITDLLYYRAARVWLAFLPNVDWKEALQTPGKRN